MKAVVTGGLGFLGGFVSSALAAQGYQVTTFDVRAKPASAIDPLISRHVHGDVRDESLLEATVTETDLVVHLAALVGSNELDLNPRQAIDVNVGGVVDVLECARRLGVRKVILPAKPNEPNNVYTVGAQAAEKLGHTYRERFGMDVRVMRMYTAFGPGQPVGPVNRVVPTFCAKAILGLPIEVHGDGKQSVDLMYAPDAARSLVRFAAVQKAVTTTYECPVNCRATVFELAQLIVELVGSASEVIRMPVVSSGTDIASITRAAPLVELVGESAVTPFREALLATVSYYRGLSRQLLESELRLQAMRPSSDGASTLRQRTSLTKMVAP
jgi:UDP-glucose 4-epimerase